MGMGFDLQSIIRNVSKIRLPGGMVGKVCTVLIVVAVAIAAIAWSVKVVWVSVLALVLLFLLCFVMLWRVISFADRNPQAAILEGAEFLMHEQMMLGTKLNPQIRDVLEKYMEARPVVLPPGEDKQVVQPDQPAPQIGDIATPENEGNNG
jgi:hypothetical protein